MKKAGPRKGSAVFMALKLKSPRMVLAKKNYILFLKLQCLKSSAKESKTCDIDKIPGAY